MLKTAKAGVLLCTALLLGLSGCAYLDIDTSSHGAQESNKRRGPATVVRSSGISPALQQEIRTSVDTLHAAVSAGDLDAALASLHPKSAQFLQWKSRFLALFRDATVEQELLSLTVVGQYEEYVIAIAEASTTVIKRKASFLKNLNEYSEVLIFKQHEGQYKLWSIGALDGSFDEN